MSLLILLFCVKNLRVEMGYEQIITNGKKQDFEPSWDWPLPPPNDNLKFY